MDFGLIIYDVNGQPLFQHCRTKKAFLQKISDLINEYEAKGATLFDLLLNTAINKE